MGHRQYGYEWREVPWSESLVLTRGRVDGLPLLQWGWAPRERLATVRQLRARGLRPGSADPVALLLFGHRKPARRIEFANLYMIERAKPKREATPAQLTAIAVALRARRTCQECGQVAPYYLSTVSRMCHECETRLLFWEKRAAEYGWG
jgi:hypothetical protein